MARPLRISYEGAVYHVTARGNERRNIVVDDDDRRRFVKVLLDVCGGWDRKRGESLERFERADIFGRRGFFRGGEEAYKKEERRSGDPGEAEASNGDGVGEVIGGGGEALWGGGGRVGEAYVSAERGAVGGYVFIPAGVGIEIEGNWGEIRPGIYRGEPVREQHEEEGGEGFEVPEKGGGNCRKQQGKDLNQEFYSLAHLRFFHEIR